MLSHQKKKRPPKATQGRSIYEQILAQKNPSKVVRPPFKHFKGKGKKKNKKVQNLSRIQGASPTNSESCRDVLNCLNMNSLNRAIDEEISRIQEEKSTLIVQDASYIEQANQFGSIIKNLKS